jgi:hypothetical protein
LRVSLRGGASIEQMATAKKPAKHDTLTGPSTGRTIEVDPNWLAEAHPAEAKPPPKTTIEVDPAWLTEGDPAAGPPALPSRPAKPPPLGAPPALRGKRAVAPSIPRDDPDDAPTPPKK